MPRGSLTPEDIREIIDLYVWGMQMAALEMFYDVDRATIKAQLRKNKIELRPPYRKALATTKGRRRPDPLKSNRPQIPEGSYAPVDAPSVDQLIHSSARALQDKRIAERR